MQYAQKGTISLGGRGGRRWEGRTTIFLCACRSSEIRKWNERKFKEELKGNLEKKTQDLRLSCHPGFPNLQLYREYSYLHLYLVPLIASPSVFLNFPLKKLTYNATASTISPAGHTDHATFSMQLTTSDYHRLQHHILTLSKPFTNQFNEYTTLMSYWLALQPRSITWQQPSLLVEGNSDLVDATNMRRAFYKDSHSHFTIHLQMWHQNIMLQVMMIKHFWKQSTCYTDVTPVTLHCFFILYLLLFTTVAFLNYTYAYMVRAEHFILFCIYAMLVKKAFIQVKNLEVTEYKYTTNPKYLTPW